MAANKSFQEYLETRHDRIDNAAFELMRALLDIPEDADEDEDPLPWDMESIGDATDAVAGILDALGLTNEICQPYYAEDIPCYVFTECKKTKCPFRIK